jgi:hypothetical protein
LEENEDELFKLLILLFEVEEKELKISFGSCKDNFFF